jgi:sugar phosphate isomerase/epimerase
VKPAFAAEPIADDIRPTKIAYSKECLSELADFAATCGAVIAVEDLPRTCLGNCSAEMLDLISANDRLRICFDTNHMLSEPLDDFLRACGDKIVTTHVSDYDFKNERHWLPGEGDVNWKSLFDTFDEVGYEGPILYELSRAKETETMKREHEISPADFVRNHRELEERADLTVFGTRTPGLLDWREANWYTKKK